MEATIGKTVNWSIEKLRVMFRYLAIQTAIAVPVTFLYWGISTATPTISKTLTLIGFENSLRLANALRGLVTVSPGAVVGTGVGANIFNSTQGRPDVILPIAMVAIGLAIHGIAKLSGKSIIKDILLVALYGAIGGFLVTVKKLSIALLLSPVIGEKFMAYLFTYKMWTSVVIYLLGFAIYKCGSFVVKRLRG